MPATECIENLSPSWDETHYDMDLVGNDWLNLTQNSMYKMDRFLDTTLSGGSGDKYDPTHTRPLGYYDQTDLPFYYELATQFATDDNWYSPIAANTVPNRMYLFAGTSYGHAFPPTDPNDPAWQRPTILPRPDGRGNHLALLLPGQQRVPGELGRLERSPDPGQCAQHSGVLQHSRQPECGQAIAAGDLHRARQLDRTG